MPGVEPATRAKIASLLILLLVGCAGDSHKADVLLEEAAELLRARSFRAARARIDAAIQADPRRPETYLEAAGLYNAAGRHAEANRIREALARRFESSQLSRELSTEEKAQVYYAIGGFYSTAGNITRAERALKSGLRLAPDSAELLNSLGYLYADSGVKLREAYRLIRRAVELAPNAGHIVDSLGWAEYKLGLCADSVKTLRRAVELLPDDATVRYHLAAAYTKSGRRAEAVIELRKSLLLDPRMHEAKGLLRRLRK